MSSRAAADTVRLPASSPPARLPASTYIEAASSSGQSITSSASAGFAALNPPLFFFWPTRGLEQEFSDAAAVQKQECEVFLAHENIIYGAYLPDSHFWNISLRISNRKHILFFPQKNLESSHILNSCTIAQRCYFLCLFEIFLTNIKNCSRFAIARLPVCKHCLPQDLRPFSLHWFWLQAVLSKRPEPVSICKPLNEYKNEIYYRM